VKYTMMYPGTSRIMIKGVMRGTTFTGHPLRTTLGNTLRMYFYTSFICNKAGIDMVHLHAGDDVLAYVSREESSKFITTMQNYAL
jgi:hypothetical protein